MQALLNPAIEKPIIGPSATVHHWLPRGDEGSPQRVLISK